MRRRLFADRQWGKWSTLGDIGPCIGVALTLYWSGGMGVFNLQLPLIGFSVYYDRYA
jgi:hypothetical protein